MARAFWTARVPLRRSQGRPEVRDRLRHRSLEAVDVPPHRRSRPRLWRANSGRRRGDVGGLSRGARYRLRSGAGISVRQAHERREVRANLLGRLAREISGNTPALDTVRLGLNGALDDDAVEGLAHLAQRILQLASRLAKSGISAARASSSLSPRGASSGTNGPSRQSRRPGSAL